MRTIPKYGWKPSLPDARDQFFFSEDYPHEELPSEFSLRGDLPPVLDQEQLGSCTANALAGLVQFENMLAGTDFGVPSRLFIYYMERLAEGTVQEDSGAYGRDGFAALRKGGVPPEELWPYQVSHFREKPSEDAYNEAVNHKIHHYTHLRNHPAEVKHLIILKKPVAFGFTVFSEFENQKCLGNGLLDMPGPESQVLGGHEVYVMGWKPDDAYEELYECRNSWGSDVMDEGNFWMPKAMLFGGYASDHRAIQN